MTSDEIHMHALGVVPEAIPAPEAMVPEYALDAALCSYAALEAEVAPVYRRARDAEESRDLWRLVALSALVALVIAVREAIR